jgi:hypothetical protein
MKALVVGSAVAAVLLAASSAHAQNNNSNLPFLRPQNGAQVQIPSGWPPGSGNLQTRPPTSYSAPGGYAPFQGNRVGPGNSVGDRGMDRGVVGEPESSQPRADTADPLIGTPGRAIMRKHGQGNDKPGSVQQEEPGRSQSNIARNIPKEEEALPRVIRLPQDKREREGVVFDLFRKTREVKPPIQADMPAAIGSRLPAAWVYRNVPETVTRALPSYFGYVYTNVDGRYVVCDPATYKVIAVYAESAS